VTEWLWQEASDRLVIWRQQAKENCQERENWEPEGRESIERSDLYRIK